MSQFRQNACPDRVRDDYLFVDYNSYTPEYRNPHCDANGNNVANPVDPNAAFSKTRCTVTRKHRQMAASDHFMLVLCCVSD